MDHDIVLGPGAQDPPDHPDPAGEPLTSWHLTVWNRIVMRLRSLRGDHISVMWGERQAELSDPLTGVQLVLGADRAVIRRPVWSGEAAEPLHRHVDDIVAVVSEATGWIVLGPWPPTPVDEGSDPPTAFTVSIPSATHGTVPDADMPWPSGSVLPHGPGKGHVSGILAPSRRRFWTYLIIGSLGLLLGAIYSLTHFPHGGGLLGISLFNLAMAARIGRRLREGNR